MRKIIFGISLFIAALAVIYGINKAFSENKIDKVALQEGEKLYMQMCAACHGQTGKGEGAQYGTALNDQKFLSNVSDEDLFNYVKYGRVEAFMPEYGSILKDEDINKLVLYMRYWHTEKIKLEAPKALDGNPNNGQKLYNLYCLSCHGENGEGKKGMGTALTHPNHLKYTTDEQIWITTAYGRDDIRMAPSLKGLSGVRQLEEQEITDIISYIRSYEK